MHDLHAESSRFLYRRKLSLVYYCMHEKDAEFYGLSCMTNMQDVLGFYIKENSVWCILVCMTNMQNVLGFYTEENSVWCIIVSMKNMQNFMGFHA